MERCRDGVAAAIRAPRGRISSNTVTIIVLQCNTRHHSPAVYLVGPYSGTCAYALRRLVYPLDELEGLEGLTWEREAKESYLIHRSEHIPEPAAE